MLISLLTDFGMKDGYVGVMKGVIWGIAPGIQIADITHDVQPQNILEGALALKRAVPYFPDGTVHVAVVDPGVGTSRRAMAARIGKHFLVGPDNGLGTFLFDWAQEKGESVHFVELDRPQYWRAEVGSSFHGRDIFAPVAAHLASGVPLSELGTDIDDPVRLNLPQPQRTASGWSGQIIHIDHFGNAESNIRPECFKNETVAVVQAAGQTIEGLSITFGDRQAGEMVAMIDSDGFLAISVVNGSAALQYGLRPGDPIEVILQS